MDSGELRMERGGAEQLPVISGLSGAVHVCVAMFFNGACCELRELSLSGGHYKSPYLAAPGLPLAGSVPGVSRTSSVPRLALKDVGEGAPGSSKSVKEAAAPDPTSSTAPNGASSQPSVPAPPSDTATAAMVSGSARPSPRLAGIPVLSGPPGGPHRLLTPRTLALSEGTGMPACPERPSPQGTPRTVSSPRGALVSLCPAGMYPSPRYVSPRTPRSIQQPSPRKPEAVPATLTISQHKELDSAMRRVETLEEHLSVTLAENRRLQDALTRALGRPAAPPSDANGELDADARPDPPPPAGSGTAKRLHLSDEPPASGRGAGPETPPQVADGAGGAGAGPARVEAGTQVMALVRGMCCWWCARWGMLVRGGGGARGTRRLGCGTRRLGCGARRLGCGARRLGCGARRLGCGARRLGCGSDAARLPTGRGPPAKQQRWDVLLQWAGWWPAAWWAASRGRRTEPDSPGGQWGDGVRGAGVAGGRAVG
jgi:hypothetical protein